MKVSLAEKFPELAKQWHPTLNGNLTPDQVSAYSDMVVWWLYPYTDPSIGKHFDFIWATRIKNRSTSGHDCPYLSCKAPWTGFNDLASKAPELAKQWDYDNNGKVTPQNIYWASRYKASWIYPYIDPDTGKHFVFRWKSTVRSRSVKGCGCPFLSGQAVWIGFNDLATKYPELADQWDYENNGSFTPQNVYWASTYRASWVYHYTDPDTGKHFVFRWKARITDRSTKGNGCPFLSGQAVWTGFNDLASKAPELANQWDYEKNGSFTPQNVYWTSAYKASWVYHYTNPDTGKRFVFRWKARITDRTTKGHGCPYLAGKAVFTGFNDLATKFPELANQWDYESNGSLTPQSVYWASRYKASWVYHYTDPNTGKHFVFRWKARIGNRTIHGTGCPYLVGKAVWIGFNDLATKAPELAKQWDYDNNGKITPQNISLYSSYRASWIYSYITPDTGKHFVFRWKARIASRITSGSGCPYLSGMAVWTGFNDLASKAPELAKQWDYDNNGKITPQNIYWASRYKASWIYPHIDPDTGNHFVFRWKARVNERSAKGNGCPYLSGKAVWTGFNDLATKFPELADQWDYENNGFSPQNIYWASRYKASWVYPYSDPDTGKHYVFRWKATINERSAKGHGCPYLSGKAVWTGFNDLATKFPELADQWDFENNDSFTPQNVYWASTTTVSWIYPYVDPNTGKHFVFRWKARINNRSTKGSGCPYLSGMAVWTGFNDLATKAPELAKQWDYERNHPLTPSMVTVSSNKYVAWIRDYHDPSTGLVFKFKWISCISKRKPDGSDCPYLCNKAVWPGYNDLLSCYPEIANEWDYEKNIKSPSQVYKMSQTKYYWICSICRNTFFTSPFNRVKNGAGCKNCATRQ